MPLIVIRVPGTSDEFVTAVDQGLANVAAETPRDELRFVNVGSDRVTVLIQKEKQLISSDWQVLEPDQRADGKVFYRYTTVIEHNESAAALAGRIAALLRRA